MTTVEKLEKIGYCVKCKIRGKNPQYYYETCIIRWEIPHKMYSW